VLVIWNFSCGLRGAGPSIADFGLRIEDRKNGMGGLRVAGCRGHGAWRTAQGSRRTAQDNRFLFAGYSSLVTCYWLLVSGCGLRGTGYGDKDRPRPRPRL